jgi:hypothetical protein
MINVIKGEKLTLEQLHEIPLVRPKGAGPVWQGIQHGALVETLKDQALFMGWKVTEEVYSVSKGGTSLAGALALEIPGLPAPEGQTFSMGVLTSNNMERTLRLVVGTNVFVCHNGCATGQVVLRKKHTRNFDLAASLEDAFGKYREEAANVKTIVANLQHTPLTRTMEEAVLCEAGRQGIMCWSRIGEVDAEYHNPRFSDHGMGTSWALLNAFTWVVKKNPPLEQMTQINAFRSLLPTVAVA